MKDTSCVFFRGPGRSPVAGPFHFPILPHRDAKNHIINPSWRYLAVGIAYGGPYGNLFQIQDFK